MIISFLSGTYSIYCLHEKYNDLHENFMVQFCGMSLMTRKCERYLLLIPYILVNLMSDYRYQHDFFSVYIRIDSLSVLSDHRQLCGYGRKA